jgi:hypothetical protein
MFHAASHAARRMLSPLTSRFGAAAGDRRRGRCATARLFSTVADWNVRRVACDLRGVPGRA